MTKETLTIIAQAMNNIGLRYGFVEYSEKPIVYPYFVGEYTESPIMDESGRQDTTFILTGYSRTTFAELEDCKEMIKRHFPATGRTTIANGTGVAISYENAMIIPTWDEELKKMQITLKVQEWSVNA